MVSAEAVKKKLNRCRADLRRVNMQLSEKRESANVANQRWLLSVSMLGLMLLAALGYYATTNGISAEMTAQFGQQSVTLTTSSNLFLGMRSHWRLDFNLREARAILKEKNECLESRDSFQILFSKPIKIESLATEIQTTNGESLRVDYAIYAFEERGSKPIVAIIKVDNQAEISIKFAKDKSANSRPVMYLKVEFLHLWEAPDTGIESIKLAGTLSS